jgi:YD repeat-containing protein
VKASATSGSGGSYSISNLAPGKYDMEVVASGYGTLAVSGITVTANGSTTENFALSSPGTISGTVTKSNGTTAISGATVSVNQGYTVVGTATTNSAGTYSIPTLAPATYSVTASVSGYDSSTKNGQVVTSGGTTTTNFSLASEATINYAYDEASRLAAVVDSLNNGVVYNYDAAGNILSITKKAASAVTISDFVPNAGPVGTTVNIYGSGFSSDASLNTVTFFNNVAATVTSATPTELVTAVPTGAATGKIKVTVASSSATSSTPFTINSSNGLPTVTSFTPPIASPGTTVTINGTNFDPTASHNSLTVNVNKTYAATATTTTLTTSLPGIVTSGHITVTTTVGSYTTQSYLFVPPPGYTASQVGYTGQVALGGQVTATLSTANQIGLVVIDVPDRNGLSIGTSSTFSSNVPYTIYDPYGNVIGSGNIGTGTSYIDTTKHIAIAGTCTIMIAPGNATGGVTLSPTAISPDIYAPITLGGSPVTVATTAPGQSAHLTFSAYAGQRVYLYVYNPTGTKDQFGNQGSNINMLDPNGLQILGWGGGAPGSNWYGYSGLITLTQSANYTINFTPNGLSTWGATFQLGSVPADVYGTITVSPAGGPPAPVTVATQYIGQSAHLSFTGSPGQRLYLYVYNPTGTTDKYGDNGSSLNMLDANSNQILGWGGGAPGSNWYGYSGLLTFTAQNGSGTYTINFTPRQLSLWGATFQLVTIPADVTGTITVSPAGGPPAPVTIATQYPGQSAHLSFTGATNQRLFMWAYTPTGTKDQYGNQGSSINLLDPNNSQILGWGGGAPGSTWYGYSGLITLKTSGTYTINFAASGLSTWGATFQLVTIPADVSSSITLNTPVILSTSYTGQSGHLNFANNVQNQQVYLYIYNPTGMKDQYGNQGSSINMLDPNNNQILGWSGGAPGSTWFGCSGVLTLQSIGTYTINFTPSGLSLWGATFELMTTPCP